MSGTETELQNTKERKQNELILSFSGDISILVSDFTLFT